MTYAVKEYKHTWLNYSRDKGNFVVFKHHYDAAHCAATLNADVEDDWRYVATSTAGGSVVACFDGSHELGWL